MYDRARDVIYSPVIFWNIFFITPGIESMLLVCKSNALPTELHHKLFQTLNLDHFIMIFKIFYKNAKFLFESREILKRRIFRGLFKFIGDKKLGTFFRFLGDFYYFSEDEFLKNPGQIKLYLIRKNLQILIFYRYILFY